MRVLHVAPSVAREYGGPTVSLLGYAEAGQRGGAEITVAAPVAEGEDAGWFGERAAQIGVELRPFRGRGRDAFVRSRELGRWLHTHAASFDLVHIHGLLNPVSTMAARECRLHGVPMVIRPFGMLSRYTFTHRRGWAKRLVFRLLDGPNLRAAKAVHFTTRSEMEQAAWHGISFADRGFVVPPPLDGEAVSEASRPDDSGPPIVLFLSRLHPVKSVETLIAGWDSVLADHPAARLVIAGDGRPEYVTELRRLAVGAMNIDFVGFASGEVKRDLLASARAFVLPSYHENFGVAVAEALAAGLPVVMTPEVQLASLVQDHRLGIVVEREPQRFARAISAVLSDPALRLHCAETGPRIVAEHFSLPSVSARLMTMYRHVLRDAN
jgi:glycosyltransferase involved in cell wall biosynthesis